MTYDVAAAFGKRLRTLRLTKGFRKARHFAEAVGIKENNYTRYERGEVEPSLSLIVRFCNQLGVTPNDLFDTGPSLISDPCPRSGDRIPPQSGEEELAPSASRVTDQQLELAAWRLAREMARADRLVISGSSEGVAQPIVELQTIAHYFSELRGDPFSVIVRYLRGGALAAERSASEARVLEEIERYIDMIESRSAQHDETG